MCQRVHEDVLKQCQRLRKEGQLSTAVLHLQQTLHRGELATAKWDAAGRFLRKAFRELDRPTLSVQILGQCTTSWLTTSLTTEAWSGGVALEVTEGGYDSLIQDLSELTISPEVIVLVPWHQRLLSPQGDRTPTQRIEDELITLQQAWSMIPKQSRLVQVGYDWIQPGALGYQLGSRYSGDVRLIRRMNEALLDALPKEAYFVDLEQVSADVGRRGFYDLRNYAWTKQPFSSDGVYELSRHLFGAVRTLTTGAKKVLVLDLDNTLWGGVVGERGPLGVELGDSPDGEAFRAFQALVKQLKERGVILAACSKNNPADAREPFTANPDMLLGLEDMAAFEASWDPKPVAIQRIAETLNLGLESFVFFDDNPVEREAVRQQLPRVDVVDVPDEPADFGIALQRGLWFESVTITADDRQRSEQYCSEQHRRVAREATASLEDYLTSLQMTAVVRPIRNADMQRVTQLIGKTNQFNLTTRRHTAEHVRAMLDDENAIGVSLRLEDRFGDYGLVSVVIGLPENPTDVPTLRLDTWLMSCRAIGRTVEMQLMNCVVQRAAELGYEKIIGQYRSTAKNAQVAEFFPNTGFRATRRDPDGAAEFELTIAEFQPCETYVQLRDDCEVPTGQASHTAPLPPVIEESTRAADFNSSLSD